MIHESILCDRLGELSLDGFEYVETLYKYSDGPGYSYYYKILLKRQIEDLPLDKQP